MKSLDRNYFKEKKTGKKSKGSYTICCGQEKDRYILNKNNKEDKELIEDYCEEQLLYYHSFKSIRPECCKVCGRLIKYTVALNKETWK